MRKLRPIHTATRAAVSVVASLGLALAACGDGAAVQGGADGVSQADSSADGAGADGAGADGAVSDGAGADGRGDALVDDTSGGDVGGGDVAGDDTAGVDAIGSPDRVTVVTLLDHEPVAMANGLSQPIQVELPADVISVTISVFGSADSMYGLGQWRGPDDSVLVEEGWTQGDQGSGGLCLSCPNRIALSEGVFAAIAPNNPEPTLVPGTHVFTTYGVVQKPVSQTTQGTCGDEVCTFIDQFQCPQDCAPTPASGEVLVSVHAKIGPAAALPDTGVLDLNLHFTGAGGWTAASAPTDPSFQALLDGVRTLYSQVGITLGELHYIDIDSSYQVVESVQGPDSDLMDLFRQSEGDDPSALSLFFVNELSAGAFGGFGVVLGISGGIPGPPLVQGSHRSGVAIAVKEIPGAPAGPDTTTAHETGHFLGLYHTTEQSFGGMTPAIHDPLPDTPENDETNLMFNTGAGTILSPWQGIVMRSNPWVYHPDGDGGAR